MRFYCLKPFKNVQNYHRKSYEMLKTVFTFKSTKADTSIKHQVMIVQATCRLQDSLVLLQMTNS